MNKPLLEIKKLSKIYESAGKLSRDRRKLIPAVNSVDLQIYAGETLGLVGESGCGKSTLARLITLLEKHSSGAVAYGGNNIFSLKKEALKNYRRRVQLIFQDPYSSLNARRCAASIIEEPLIVHSLGNKETRKHAVLELMAKVGLTKQQADRYPHEFSGGQRQRISIARSIALNPHLIVCDEPVSSLDVSIRSQILNLLKQLQDQFQLTYLFISHDLAVVRHISNNVAVMYLGKILELADRDSIYLSPLHPYTLGLLNAIPIPNPKLERERKKFELIGEIPSPSNPPTGCRFHTRCPKFEPGLCDISEPQLLEIRKNHWVACHLVS